MAYKVSIRNVGKVVEVDGDDTVLAAAILGGIDYPCGCQSGNCGTCKSELLSGTVEMAPHARFALQPKERAEGLILACRATPTSDCDIAWIEPDERAGHPRRRLACKVAAVEAATHDVRIVSLEVEDGEPLVFSAGQYASLAFAGLPARDYSMASPPGAARLEFHIRALDGGVVSRHAAERLRPGDAVEVVGPFGDAQLRRHHRGPLIAIAGSTGLAPILSIVETAIAEEMPQPMHLYFGVRASRDLYAMDRLAALAAGWSNLTVIPVLAEPAAAGRHRTGLVTDAVAEDHADLDGAKAYIAGPPAMVEAAVALLRRLRIRRQDCHADAFYTEAEKAALQDSA